MKRIVYSAALKFIAVVLFVIVIASFITGVCLTVWENKHNTKLVFSNDKVVNKIITNNIVISDNSIEVLEMDVESFSDLDAEII